MTINKNTIINNGIFLVDLKELKLSDSESGQINKAIQETVQREIARLPAAKGVNLRPRPIPWLGYWIGVWNKF